LKTAPLVSYSQNLCKATSVKGIGLQAEMVAKDYLDPKGCFATRPGTYGGRAGRKKSSQR
jgi:hypothetical protein